MTLFTLLPQPLNTPLRAPLLSAAWLSLCSNLLLLCPALLLLGGDQPLLSSRNSTSLSLLVALVVVLLLCVGLLDGARASLLARSTTRFATALAEPVFAAAFNARLQESPRTSRQAFDDLSTVSEYLSARSPGALLDLPWIPVHLLVLGLLNPLLGTTALATTLLLVGLTVRFSPGDPTLLPRSQHNVAQSDAQVHDQFAAAEAVAGLGMASALRTRWLKHQRAAQTLHATMTLHGARREALAHAAQPVLQGLLLINGVWLVGSGALPPAALLAAALLLARASAPLCYLLVHSRQLAAARAAGQRLQQLLHKPPAVTSATRGGPVTLPPRPHGALVVEGVLAAPPGSAQLALKGVSFTVPAGQILAVVGPSGAGKSTLANVLVGAWPALRGSVQHIPAAGRPQHAAPAMASIGFLPQHSTLFDGSIAMNIARCGPVDPARVEAAARAAGIDALIRALPLGYDTPVGPHGERLASGQRQRIALARALYDNPALVVLDEPQAHLDEAGERALPEILHRLRRRGTTVVMLTQHARLLELADAVLVLRDGLVQNHRPQAVPPGAPAAPASAVTADTGAITAGPLATLATLANAPAAGHVYPLAAA